MAYLHERGVKGFVATNVLIFDEELEAVEAHLRHIAACGVDAVIVQAWGTLVHPPLFTGAQKGLAWRTLRKQM